jgi:hypothetical protein
VTSSEDPPYEPPPDRIEIVRKGDPAPADGFWVSRRTFMMLYEAAEKTAATGAVVTETERETAGS